MVEWMGRNFNVFPGFLAVRNIVLYSVSTSLRLHFLWYESSQKVDFFDHLPPSSCKRSL